MLTTDILSWKQLSRRKQKPVHLILFITDHCNAKCGHCFYWENLNQGESLKTEMCIRDRVWVLYLALEPYVRRYWPQAIISWTRVLAGRWRDPLVGRDVLYGAVLGIFFCDIFVLAYHLAARLGAPPAVLDTNYLGNARIALSAWLGHIPGSISSVLMMFLLLFLCRVLLRKSWLAAIGFILLFTAVKSVSSDYPAVSWPIEAILYTTLAVGALRFGLVTLAVALYTADTALNIPITLNPSAWYFTSATLALSLIHI